MEFTRATILLRNYFNGLSSYQQLALASVLGASALGLLYKRYKDSLYLESQGKAVFISGCDTGFGKAAAEEFHRLGYAVFAGCLNKKLAEEKTFAHIKSDRFEIVSLDVTKESAIDAAVIHVEKWLKSHPDYSLWCVINNAGISTFGPAEFVSMKSFEKVMDCNFFGVVRITKAFLPVMRNNSTRGGRIIFMGSIGGHLPCPCSAAYGCSKAAVLFFSDFIKMETDRFGFQVSTILPDFYQTNIMQPDESLASFNRELNQAHAKTIELYGGETYVERLRNFLTIVSPPRAKTDLSPVIQAMVHAAASKKPRRRYYPMEFTTKIATHLFDFAPDFYLSAMKNFI